LSFITKGQIKRIVTLVVMVGTSLVIEFLVSISAIAIHGLGDLNLQIPANALLFWIILALGSSIGIIARPEGRRTNS